jgi:hypothetical protein
MLVGLAILVALAAGIGWIAYTSIARAPAVVAAVVTGFAALIGLAVQRYMEQQREDRRERRERMAPIYEQLVRTFYDGAADGDVNQDDLLTFFQDLAQSLLIWGSEPVIMAFNRWRATIAELEEGSPDALFAFEELLYAIRADLGNEAKKMGRGDLLRVFINDIDDFLPPREITVTDNRDDALRDATRTHHAAEETS